MSFPEFRNAFLQSELGRDPKVIGCTERELQELETHFGFMLPLEYREFLMLLGKDAGAFLAGSDFTLKWIKHLDGFARELLEENSVQFDLTRFLTWFSHGGYFIAGFLVDDPELIVHTYLDGEDTIRKTGESFSAFLATALDEQTRVRL